MAKFIKLTPAADAGPERATWINVDRIWKISRTWETGEARAVIYEHEMGSAGYGTSGWFHVSETPEQILKLIEEAK